MTFHTAVSLNNPNPHLRRAAEVQLREHGYDPAEFEKQQKSNSMAKHMQGKLAWQAVGKIGKLPGQTWQAMSLIQGSMPKMGEYGHGITALAKALDKQKTSELRVRFEQWRASRKQAGLAGVTYLRYPDADAKVWEDRYNAQLNAACDMDERYELAKKHKANQKVLDAIGYFRTLQYERLAHVEDKWYESLSKQRDSKLKTSGYGHGITALAKALDKQKRGEFQTDSLKAAWEWFKPSTWTPEGKTLNPFKSKVVDDWIYKPAVGARDWLSAGTTADEAAEKWRDAGNNAMQITQPFADGITHLTNGAKSLWRNTRDFGKGAIDYVGEHLNPLLGNLWNGVSLLQNKTTTPAVTDIKPKEQLSTPATLSPLVTNNRSLDDLYDKVVQRGQDVRQNFGQAAVSDLAAHNAQIYANG
jgi:hypothetical protein